MVDLKVKQVTTEVTRVIVQYLESQELDLNDLAQKTGASRDFFMKAEGKIPIHYELQLWDYAAEKTQDRHLGLTLASLFELENLGVIGYLSLQQNTLFEMMTTFSHYHRLVHEEAILEVGCEAECDVLEHRFSTVGDGPGAYANEVTLGAIWKIIQLAASEPLTLQGVCFQHHAPDDWEPYPLFFGQSIDLKFSQLSNKLIFPPGTLDTPLKESDSRLAKILKSQADQALASLPQSSEWESALYQSIAELIAENNVHIDTVAERLGFSRRTLQRRLGEKNLIFRDTVESVQKRFALRYLDDPSLNVTEVGYLCGFSELSSFSRAFKRWTGKSPQEFRRQD